MMDFTQTDLLLRSAKADREREARAIVLASEASPAPRGLRATMATRFARLALRLDRDTTGKMVACDLQSAGWHFHRHAGRRA
jgi:hypothetical protein